MIVLHLIELGVLAGIAWAVRPKKRKPVPRGPRIHDNDDLLGGTR